MEELIQKHNMENPLRVKCKKMNFNLLMNLSKKDWIASGCRPRNDGMGGDVIANPASSLRGRIAAEAIQKLKFIKTFSTPPAW